MVPMVPASDAVKENASTAPALPSPAAILPEQPCIEAEVSLATRKATSPQHLLESMKTVKFFLLKNKLTFLTRLIFYLFRRVCQLEEKSIKKTIRRMSQLV